MKQTFSVSGREIIVEDGVVKFNGKSVSGYQILGVNQAPKSVQDAVRKSGIDVRSRVYFGGAVIPKEIAECALSQQAEIRRAKEIALETNVPGLDILRDAINDLDRYHREFNRMMEDESNDGINPPRRPTEDIKALKIQYPRAAAYLKAESYNLASHYAKAMAGRRAMDALAAGVDADAALKTMEDEWSAAVQEAIMRD